jgi:quinolinate synthase
MSDNIQIENPNINFVKPCNLCPHMKKITLQGILRSLKEEINFVEIDSKIIQRAKGAIEKMIAVGR